MNYQELISNIQTSGNEFELRKHLSLYLDEKIAEKLKKNNNLKKGIWEEKRMDLYYPNVVIETKAYKRLTNKKTLEEGKLQVQRYMKQNLVKFGCLTDGYKIFFFQLKKHNKRIETEELNTSYGNSFNEANLKYLLNLVITNDIFYLNPYNLVVLFGNTENNKFIKNILKKFLDFFESNESLKKDMLFKEWDKLFKISEEGHQNKEEVINRRKSLSEIFDKEINDTEKESKALFILHNVLSIIIKLLVYNNLAKINKIGKIDIQKCYSDIEYLRNFMYKLENGILFYQIGIYNLTIYDYFSWYIDKHIEWNKDFKELLLDLIEKVNLIVPVTDNITYTIDYMEELYRKFIPKAIRHSFGEFFTPSHIAEFAIKDIAQMKPSDKIIDPTCGSGTFLIQAIKIKRDKNQSLNEIINSIAGIDLNPINVLLSKFNIVTNLLDKIEKSNETELIIPIFIGDSSYTPQIVSDGENKIIKYKWLSNIKEFGEKIMPEIIFPLEFVRNKKFFSIMQQIKEYIEDDIDIEYIKKYLNKELKDLKINLNANIKHQLENLITFIYNYHKTNMNSIWLFIFISYIYPFAIAPYDKVVGNPPWVRWSNLPSFYKEKIKNTLREKGLFSSDTNTGGVDLNIYALITYNSLMYLLKKGGTLTFLLPSSSLQNKSLEGFRYLCFEKYASLQKPIYFSKGKIFEEVDLDFVILKIQKK
jgi:type I restriction-modification system DNA methylase subunit